MQKRKMKFSLLALFFFTQIILNAAPFEAISSLPKGVSIYQLDNGIKVLLIENPALPMIGVNTVVKVGSAYETFSSSGMSHMLEHLLFNGTSEWNQKELYDLTDKIGGYNNANTSEYYTNFMMVTPADKIKQGMEIQAGMLFDSILPDDKFEKEKGIVLEEIAKSLAKPNEQLDRNTRDILYSGHALSLPTLGTYGTIKGMNRDEVYDFYKNNYVPNNMLMSVIGNFKTSEMLKILDEVYGKAAPGNVLRPDITGWGTGFTIPYSQTTETVSHRFYKGEKSILQQFYKINNSSPDFFFLLEIALSKQKDKLETELKEAYPHLVKEISFSDYNYPVGSFLEVDVVLENEENLSEISNTLDRIIKKITVELSAKEIESEIVKAKTDFLKQIEKPHMFGIYNANLIAEHGLNAILEAFNGEGIFNAGNELKNFSFPNSYRLIIQHPAVENVASDNEKKIELFNNGAEGPTVIAKQNSASNLLAIHYMFKYKHQYELKFGKDASKKWHDAFGNRMNSEANKKIAAKYGLTFVVNDISFIPMDDIYLSPTFGYIRVEGLADDIEGAIKYLNNEMLNFIPTEEEFNKVNKSNGFSMMMGGRDKSKELYESVYDSLVMEPDKEIPDSIILDYSNLLQFGREYFVPSNIIISVTSKLPPKEINRYFEGFKSNIKPKYEGLAKERGFIKRDKAVTVIRKGGGEQSRTFYGFVKNYEKTDEAPLIALSLMLRDEIVFNIREKQGLAYRMSAGIRLKDDKALFYVEVPTQPQNVDKLVPQFEGLFSSNFADTITQDKLDKTINMYLGRMMFRRLSSINQAYYLAHSLFFDGNIEADEQNLEALKNVSLDDVKSVIEKYMRIENPIKIVIQ